MFACRWGPRPPPGAPAARKNWYERPSRAADEAADAEAAAPPAKPPTPHFLVTIFPETPLIKFDHEILNVCLMTAFYIETK